MRHAHYYKRSTGEFIGVSLSAPDEAIISANCPAGCSWYCGEVDQRRQRVVLVTDDFGEVVQQLAAWRPPKPADTELRRWAWSEEAKDWLPELTEAAHAANARLERSARLAACDWVVTKAQEIGQPVPSPWREYRQALRDVSKQPGWPLQIDWPIQPE